MNKTRLIFITVLTLTALTCFAGVRKAPETRMLPGTWHYTTVRIVADAVPDNAPQLEQHINELLKNSSVTAESCLLTFHEDDRHCTFGVNSRSFRLAWKLDPATCAFSSSVGPFKVKGSLYTAGENLCLLYAPPTLLMMMRFICPLSAKRYIDEIEDFLDAHPDMQLAVEFSK